MKSNNKKHVLTCGSCSGLTRDKLVGGNTTVCSGQGKIPSAKACNSFKPDAFALAPINDKATDKNDALNQLAECISEFTISELQVLAALFLGEKKTRQNGFAFWQKVYVRYRGTSSDDYLSNFVTGRVLDADKEFVRIISETGKSCIQVVNDKHSSSLYSASAFRAIRKAMIAADRKVDPALERAFKKSASTSLMIQPLDFAVASGDIGDDFNKSNKKIRKSQRMDLVDIVEKMASGKILKRKEKKAYNFGDDVISIHHA